MIPRKNIKINDLFKNMANNQIYRVCNILLNEKDSTQSLIRYEIINNKDEIKFVTMQLDKFVDYKLRRV